jgi:hypothetical protein
MNSIKKSTAYANSDTKSIVENGSLGNPTGKVIYMAGKVDDFYGNPNTVFQADSQNELVPDMDNPLGHFSATVTNGLPELGFTAYDQYAEAIQVWSDLKSKYGAVGASKKIATANIVNSQTIDQTKSLNILDRVLGLQVRDFFLQTVVTPIPSPQLVFTVDTYNDGSVQGKVPELDEAQLISHTETRSTQILYKNIGHIAISEEADMKQSHPTMQLRQDKTMKDMARLINSQIATVMATATDVAGSDWGAVSGTPPDSANNPINDIQSVMTTIEGAGFNVDYIAGHDRPITDLLTNKFIRGRGNVGIGTDVLLKNVGIHEVGLPSQIVKDQALPNTTALIGSKDAIWLGQGATIVANYLNDQAGYRGWLVKQWWLPYLAQDGAIRELTGVSA